MGPQEECEHCGKGIDVTDAMAREKMRSQASVAQQAGQLTEAQFEATEFVIRHGWSPAEAAAEANLCADDVQSALRLIAERIRSEMDTT